MLQAIELVGGLSGKKQDRLKKCWDRRECREIATVTE
jgi:hypothetical protein